MGRGPVARSPFLSPFYRLVLPVRRLDYPVSMAEVPGTRGVDPVAPEHLKEAFNCPHCGAYAEQTWGDGQWVVEEPSGFMPMGPATHRVTRELEDLQVASCRSCLDYSLWWRGESVYPAGVGGPLPNSDLPEDIRADFQEARSIVNASPRGAAALLRLCVQKLCIHLDQSGKNLSDDIAALVKRGLSVSIQQALDIVRVVGNNAVHPGEMDLRDDAGTATALFGLVNAIADAMITQPKNIAALYDTLPAEDRERVQRRDSQPG
jgi:hypothetical protein